jgi:hypothetical protein
MVVANEGYYTARHFVLLTWCWQDIKIEIRTRLKRKWMVKQKNAYRADNKSVGM